MVRTESIFSFIRYLQWLSNQVHYSEFYFNQNRFWKYVASSTMRRMVHSKDNYVFKSLWSLPRDFSAVLQIKKLECSSDAWCQWDRFEFSHGKARQIWLRIQCLPVNDADVRVLNDNLCVKMITKLISLSLS